MENKPESVFVELKGETFPEFAEQCTHRSKRDADTVYGETVAIFFCEQNSQPCIGMSCNRIRE